ncbi:ABC transporter ATP-binding protein [Mesorhizobium sp. BAC0120]|uniref:energy-coupling factor ABC transporter ATP-binding protein n=1 Tax=Mesorhizobium sp. BAC0120 TaxID=3090670 RepID=UPI00298CEE18|nr:ABC transporter ATP-binding protein [Mesorhizobium sp. BAC0120]MDW6023212.1 ABC transporter ATP-binding protein [Mesorhizobium sp. BAC0120]
MALIDIKNLTFGYGAKGPAVLKGLNLSIESGERLAILGGNGSGKTTLAHWIAGWLPRPAMEASQGEVLARGKAWPEWNALDRAATVQFVGQIPMQQLSGFAFTVYDEIVFGPGNLGLSADEIRTRADWAIDICNLRHLVYRDPFTLSGGEQQRLSIAAALVMNPKALVLDEPTGNFDPESRDNLLEQIKGLPRDLTIILFDMALKPALAVAERFVLLDDGGIVADGLPEEVIQHPAAIDMFGLPAVTEAALLIRESGKFPGKARLPLTFDQAVRLFGGVPAC